MSTPQSTPVKHGRLGLVSTKFSPLTNEFKRLLCDQHQRLTLKHQQDLDLLDDIRSYVKARLSIERDYTNALQKLAKQHSNHIQKKFQLLHQLDRELELSSAGSGGGQFDPSGTSSARANSNGQGELGQNSAPVGFTKHQHSNSGEQQPNRARSLYKVWSDHISCLQSTAKNRAEQFDQSNLIVDKLKDIRQHKASIGKKCLDTHLRRVQEDLLASMLDVDKAKKLYYEDESQAKKARENEERIKKRRSGLLTKFTDLQAKKEKSSAQREANDIQSTQARNDYIMALAAANSHLNYYYYRDLKDFIHLIDDGVLDHCKIFMATLSECDIDSLKDSLSHAQYWSKLINLTGSQQTNQIFLDCEQSKCLRDKQELQFEPCNNDSINKISLEHNADYALQHEIDKWFTWFKKECRNLSQLIHQLDACQQAFADGKKSIELNGQTIDDLEPKIIDLKQQIRKCEAAKLRAQARLMVIKEGGMQIEEWSAVELEIRASMARAQEERERAKRNQEPEETQDGRTTGVSFDEPGAATGGSGSEAVGGRGGMAGSSSIHLQVMRDSDDSDTQADESMHNLASVSRSTSNLVSKQQQAMAGFSAFTDPSLVWQDDYSAAWGPATSASGAVTADQEAAFQESERALEQPVIKPPTSPRQTELDAAVEIGGGGGGDSGGYDTLGAATNKQPLQNDNDLKQTIPNASMSIQSSSPLSAIVNGGQHLSQSPYQGAMSEAYKSDYECDYTRIGQHQIRSAASSVEPSHLYGGQLQQQNEFDQMVPEVDKMLNRQVIALYKFEKNNHDDLEFEEYDLLEVIEVNASDPNWVKARHSTNGAEGYIPSSYVRLYDDREQTMRRGSSAVSASNQLERQSRGELRPTESMENNDYEGNANGPSYYRALYDYSPSGEAIDEEDGLPHLALKMGELIKVIDQGEHDGWCLVEKHETGQRGHVPSMLIEEVEPGDELEEVSAEGDDDDGDVTEDDGAVDEENAFQEPPPNFEPPVLRYDDAATNDDEAQQGQQVSEGGPELCASDTPTADQITEKHDTALIPKSFIVIEPTPVVESKRFEDGLESFEELENRSEIETRESSDSIVDTAIESQVTRQVVQSTSSQKNYSVYNENFVLERPTRHGATITSTQGNQPHESSVVEEQNVELKPYHLEQEEDFDEFGFDKNRPPPPSVVIDSVEAIPRSPDLSFDEPDRNESNVAARHQDDTGDDHSNEDAVVKSSSEFQDVNPILRHHADEFTKQLIEEALLLAPGSRIGPSTSSNDMQNSDDSEQDESDGNEQYRIEAYQSNHVGSCYNNQSDDEEGN